MFDDAVGTTVSTTDTAVMTTVCCDSLDVVMIDSVIIFVVK